MPWNATVTQIGSLSHQRYFPKAAHCVGLDPCPKVHVKGAPKPIRSARRGLRMPSWTYIYPPAADHVMVGQWGWKKHRESRVFLSCLLAVAPTMSNLPRDCAEYKLTQATM